MLLSVLIKIFIKTDSNIFRSLIYRDSIVRHDDGKVIIDGIDKGLNMVIKHVSRIDLIPARK